MLVLIELLVYAALLIFLFYLVYRLTKSRSSAAFAISIVGLFAAVDVLFPYFVMRGRCDESGVTVFEPLSQPVAGFFWDGSNGCDLDCLNRLVYRGYSYIEAEVENLSTLSVDTNSGLNILVTETGTYRFSKLGRPDNRCVRFDECMERNCLDSRNYRFSVHNQNFIRKYCIGVEKINKKRSQYIYQIIENKEKFFNGKIITKTQIVKHVNGLMILQTKRITWEPRYIFFLNEALGVFFSNQCHLNKMKAYEEFGVSTEPTESSVLRPDQKRT